MSNVPGIKCQELRSDHVRENTYQRSSHMVESLMQSLDFMLMSLSPPSVLLPLSSTPLPLPHFSEKTIYQTNKPIKKEAKNDLVPITLKYYQATCSENKIMEKPILLYSMILPDPTINHKSYFNHC